VHAVQCGASLFMWSSMNKIEYSFARMGTSVFRDLQEIDARRYPRLVSLENRGVSLLGPAILLAVINLSWNET
jgi:hypothetical protein